jgi:hypothetical protein
MPLLYGEGRRAFSRLEEEIIKQTNDMTMIAWNLDIQRAIWTGVLANSPQAFSQSFVVQQLETCPEFSATNRAVLVSTNSPLRIVYVKAKDILDHQSGDAR